MTRLAIVLGLRILALLLTFFTIARPTLLVRKESKVPSVLIVLLDRSESMTFKDEDNNQTRSRRCSPRFANCAKIIKELEEEHQISVITLGIAGDVNDWTAAARRKEAAIMGLP